MALLGMEETALVSGFGGLLTQPFVDEAGRKRQLETRLPRSVRPVAMDPKSRLVAVGCKNQVRVYETPSLRLVRVLCGHTGYILQLAWSPNNRWLASGDSDGVIRLWNPHDGTAGTVLRAHASGVYAPAWNHDGSLLANGGSWGDNSIATWQPDGACIRELRHGEPVVGLSWHPSEDWLVSAGMRRFYVWKVSDGSLVHKGKHPSDISQVACSPDGKWLAVAGGNRGHDFAIRIWNTTNWTESKVLKGHRATVNDIAWSPNGRQLVSAGQDTWVHLWDPIAGERIRSLGQHRISLFPRPNHATVRHIR